MWLAVLIVCLWIAILVLAFWTLRVLEANGIGEPFVDPVVGELRMSGRSKVLYEQGLYLHCSTDVTSRPYQGIYVALTPADAGCTALISK